MRRRVLVLIALALVPAGVFRSDEGRIPIYRPTVITQPGHYVVTRDIAVSAGIVLDVQVPGVTVDLNGHTLASSSLTDDVIKIGDPNLLGDPNVKILNGRLQGGGIAIHAIPPGPCKLTVQDVVIGDSNIKGIFVEETSQAEIHGIVINGRMSMPGPMIDLRASSTRPRCSATISEIRSYGGPDSKGIALTHVVGVIQDGVIQEIGSGMGAPGPAISFIDAPGSTIQGMTIQWVQEGGDPSINLINSSGIIINDNNLRGPATAASPTSHHGIFADSASHDLTLTNNSITGAGGDGIHVDSQGNLLLGNLVGRNTGEGIFIAGSNNLVDGNKVAGNLGNGLYFNTTGGAGHAHVYRNNVLRGNLAAVAGPGSTGVTDAGGNVP